ncbi:MAG: hypothetical protein RIK87_05305 [Fuerstiella sp.]
MLILETIQTDGIAQLSYLVGDTESGVAAVIDPRTDVDICLRKARQYGLAINAFLRARVHASGRFWTWSAILSGTG